MAKEKNQEKESVFIDGVLRSAFTHEDKNEDGSIVKKTNVITIFSDPVSIDGSDTEKAWVFFDSIYEGKPNKYVPKWYKERSGVTFKSVYNVPVRIKDSDKRMSFEEFVKRGLIRGAKIHLKANVKEQALYPVAFEVIEDGEEYDAFADF